MTELENIPKKSVGDFVHTTVKTWLSVVPVIWWPLTELFSAIIGAPIEKRRDEWINAISKDLNELNEKVDSLPETLSSNEWFITVLLNASQVAIKNHHKEKLEALRNIVIWVATNLDTNLDIALIFIQLIDKLTPSHLRILRFFNDPIKFMNEEGRQPRSFWSIWEAMRYVIPEISANAVLQEKILKDLDNENLTKNISSSVNTMMTSSGVTSGRLTNLWKEFLVYIVNSDQ